MLVVEAQRILVSAESKEVEEKDNNKPDSINKANRFILDSPFICLQKPRAWGLLNSEPSTPSDEPLALESLWLPDDLETGQEGIFTVLFYSIHIDFLVKVGAGIIKHQPDHVIGIPGEA